MAGRVRWARRASEDLIEIAEHIEGDAPEAAVRFVRRLLEAARSLEDLPRRGRRVTDLEPSGLRQILVEDYRLLYRIDDEGVVSIVAVVHGSRDLPTLWEREGRE